MDHRHLLPNEIDLLVDGYVGFGMAPLRDHLTECSECSARVDELRAVTELIDSLPHHMPRLQFADSVMRQVQVIEPWHVALTESAKRLVPSSTPLRVLAGAGAGVAAVAVSGSAVWLGFRADLASWVFNLMLDRGRDSIVVGASELAAGALGSGASAAIAQGGLPVVAIGTALLAASVTVAVAGFRRLAATARSNRS